MPQTQGYLIIEKKSGTDGKPHPVDRTLKLGRGQSCDVRVHVQSVSDEHCIIIVEPGKPVCVRNLSETTPTLLNGVSIGNKKCELQHGDYVSIGERRFRWEYLDTSPFYRLELGNMRRKSDADAIVRRTSQPIAVVLPMIHSRRTIEPSIVSQVKLNFARVSAGSKLSVPADVMKASGSSLPPEKVSDDQSSMPEIECSSSLKRIGQQTDSAVFKTPRKVIEGKTESRKSLRTSVTPQNKRTSSASKETPKSAPAQKVSAGKAQKRKLSVTPIPAKRLKIESPKSLDKRKVAALWGIHGKSPAAIRTVTPTKSESSVKKTANSTAKKSAQSTAKKSAKTAPRSIQKARRPLFSEILKKAVARANAPPKTPGKTKLAVATKKTLFSGVAKKKAVEKQQSLSALTKVLPKLHVQSTGHANSPETFFVGRKLAQSRVSQGVSKSPAEWVKSARKSAAVSDLPKQATPKRKGPLRSSKGLASTSSPVAKSPVKSPKIATPKNSPFRFTARRSATPKSVKRTSLANPLSAKTPVRTSLKARGSPATMKATTKATTPKVATPKAATPKAATPKAATPKAATPKAATPKAATPKAATPKAATPKAATPKAATPKAATPKAATPKPVTPKATTPKPITRATPTPVTPKVATAKSASPKTIPELAKPSPRVLKRVLEKSVKRASLPIPLRIKTPRLAKRASLPKSSKPVSLKSLKRASPAKSPKPTTPKAPSRESVASSPKPSTSKSPIRLSLAKSPKPSTPKSPIRLSLAKSPKPSTPKSPIRLSLAKSPKPSTPKSPIRLSLAKSPKPRTPRPSVRVSLSRSLKPSTPRPSVRVSLAKSPKPSTPKSPIRLSLAKSPKPITPKSPKYTTPTKTPQSSISVPPHRMSFADSSDAAVSKEATPVMTPKAATPAMRPATPAKSGKSKAATPNPAITPKQETPKVATPPAATVKPSTPRSPQRLPVFSSPNPVLEAMKRASVSGSPVHLKRISFPSSSDSSVVDVRGTPTEAASSAKRARESSPNALSPEKSKRSAFGDSLVQSLRDRMAKFSPDRSKRFSTASTVVLKSPAKSASSLPVTSTPAPGHRSSILIHGSSGPFSTSPPKSAKSQDSSGRSKNLSVTFSDVLVTPGCTPSSSKGASLSVTPENEKTSFDFSAVKTPNVPREMYVSSILSSSSKSSITSVKASGSAKRKTRIAGSRECVTAALCSDRRSSRSPMSPGGYVDVKGIKRLTTAPIKSPTYLAVEGVKRLFGEAKAIASDSYTSISGVRELFASPSPSRNRSPEKTVARDSVASSPVAKIQAQVEERNWNAPVVESPKPAPTQRKKVSKASVSSESPVQVGRTTRSAVNPRVRLASPPKEKPKGKKPVLKSPPRVEPESPAKADSPAKTSSERSKPAQGKHRRVVSFDLPEDYSSPTAPKRGTKDIITSSVTQQEEKGATIVAKRGRTTRATAEEKTSPAKEQTSPVAKRGRATRVTVEERTSPAKEHTSPVAKRGRTTRAKAEEKTSPVKEQTSPVAKRGRPTRAKAEEKTSPVKEQTSPVAKRGRPTRAKAEEKTLPVKEHTSPVAKRGRATRGKVEEKTSPVKEQTSPVTKRGRTTRGNLTESATASPVAKRGRSSHDSVAETASPEAKRRRPTRGNVAETATASPVVKRGRPVRGNIDETALPAAKRGRTSLDNVAETVSPVAKRGRATRKNVSEDKPASPNKKSKTKKDETVSPVSKRLTRKADGKPKTSPVAKLTTRAKKAASPAKTTKAKKTSKAQSPKPSPKPSPRKTRQRK